MARLAGIAVTAYSNLGAVSYMELGMTTEENSCLNTDIIRDLAEKYSRSPA
jgi:diketogulonate reductase-like aldo/keto reductase